MATTPFGFASKMHNLGNRVPAGLPSATFEAGRFVERSVKAVAPARLRNVGRSGARIGARTLPPRRTGSDATAVVRATGPFHLVEHQSGAHVIMPKGSRRNAGISGKGSAAKKKQRLYGYLFGGGGGRGSPAVRFADGKFRNVVQHPGVRSPSRPFARGVAIAAPQTSRIYHEALVADIRRALL